MELKKICKEAHQTAKEHGFWNEGIEIKNVGEAIALMHSELSEGFEAYRKNGLNIWIDKKYKKSKLQKKEGLPIELADCIIRIADFCYAFNIPLDRLVKEKMEFNKSRPYKHNKKC